MLQRVKRLKFNAGLVLFLFIFSTTNSHCQILSRIDSLENLLSVHKKNDEQRLETLLDLTKEYGYVSPDSGIIYGELALNISREMGDIISEMLSLRYLGVSYHFMDEYNNALAYYDSSLALAVISENKDGEGACLFNIGSVFEYIGDYNKALEYYLRSMKIKEETGDKGGYAYILVGIGNIYKQQRNYNLALEHFQKSHEINLELGLHNEIAYSLYNIGFTYMLMNDLETSLEIHMKSLEIRKSINDKNGIAVSLEAIGKIYSRRSDYNMAVQYYTEALKVAQEIESRWIIISSMLNLGNIYTKTKKFDLALEYLENALEQALATESKELLRNSYESLAEYYSDVRDYNQSLEYYKLYTFMKDSIYYEESSKQIAEMQTIYETDKKDQEIKLAKAEIQRNEAEINKQNLQRNALTGGVLLFIVLMLVVYRSYRQKKQDNTLLTRQNAEINQKREEIETQRDNLESLNQQLKIQKETLQNTLKDLKQAQSQLVESDRMASLGQITGGIAHELNNPINFISGNVNPLKRDINDILRILAEYDSTIENKDLREQFVEVEALKEELDLSFLSQEIINLLEGIDTGARRSEQIVKGLRSFARMDGDKFTFADIHEGLDATLTLLENKTKEYIRINKLYGDIPKIKCLPAGLNQVFLNILTNSIQAIEGKGEISIETNTSGDCVNITLKDTGRGMAADVITHIFEPFYTTRAVGDGTGLGLSISYGIIERHQGKIEVKSEPGNGSEFTIILPVR